MGQPRIVVIGAGIGGLTAASALQRAGYEVSIYEQAPQAGEVGAGLQLGPNSYKVLRGLGLERKLLEVASEITTLVTLEWRDGSPISFQPMGPTARQKFGAPYLTASRTDLHSLLLESISNARLSFGMRCAAVETKGNGAVARFTNGAEVEADAIIGCDGINSVVRQSVFGKDNARFTKGLYFRGKIEFERIEALGLDCFGPGYSLRDYVSWLGPTGRVMFYPMTSGRFLSIAAGYTTEQWTSESWSTPSSKEEVLTAYSGWDERMLALLRQVEQWFKWGVFDRDPMPTWGSGVVTLLGDAAHPFIPNLAQGASMAMEDGFVLARALADHPGDLRLGLAAYESRRRPRTKRAQLQARDQFLANLMVPPPPRIDRDWIFSFDATQATA
jgi:2-polyprenyl-6-methoxyphenol hydroxylase-like FAD-dependent oxidoreductase